MSGGVRAHLYTRLVEWGINPRKSLAALRGLNWFSADKREYERQRRLSSRPEDFQIKRAMPIYSDRFDEAGVAIGHYFHQDLIVARDIHDRSPLRHIDVGSAIYGFVSHVAAFREIEVLDVRSVSAVIPGITFKQADLMNLQLEYVNSTDSLSCLHALEHFGLGRYGDQIEYEGWQKGLSNLTSMLVKGGILYLGVPTGSIQRVEFNAHRVFSLPFLRDYLKASYSFEELSFIDDEGTLQSNIDPYSEEASNSFDAHYGCSVWTLKKI